MLGQSLIQGKQRALAVPGPDHRSATKPALLLLDEIAGGLTDGECHELAEVIKVVREGGVSIIWIEHVVHVLLAAIDRLLVINFGKYLAEGEPQSVMANAAVQEVYMGIEVE